MTKEEGLLSGLIQPNFFAPTFTSPRGQNLVAFSKHGVVWRFRAIDEMPSLLIPAIQPAVQSIPSFCFYLVHSLFRTYPRYDGDFFMPPLGLIGDP